MAINVIAGTSCAETPRRASGVNYRLRALILYASLRKLSQNIRETSMQHIVTTSTSWLTDSVTFNITLGVLAHKTGYHVASFNSIAQYLTIQATTASSCAI